MRTILTYKQVWTHRDRNGDWEYGYQCTFSDGTAGFLWDLPWGERMIGAVAL